MICTFDPGAKGAVAWLEDDGRLIAVYDMPVVSVNGKSRVSASLLATLFPADPKRVGIERVHSLPGNGSSSSFTFGYSAGLIEGICAARQYPVQMIEPAKWKRALGLSKDKGASRLMAQRLWPDRANDFARVKDDGRAEAALLGHWMLMGSV